MCSTDVGAFRQTAIVFLFFFFQAEDGIRDFHVTGVQTCALPIFANAEVESDDGVGRRRIPLPRSRSPRAAALARLAGVEFRSEERRVGKECRSRWWPDH